MRMDYKKLMKHCLPKFLKEDVYTLLQEVAPDVKLPGIKLVNVPELRDLFLKTVTAAQARALYKKYPDKFGFTCKDVKSFFGITVSTNQLEYLEDAKKIKRVGTYHSSLTDFETGTYAPHTIAKLTEEDFKVPDIPRQMNQTQLIEKYGLTYSLIKKFLPEPILRRNPYYKKAPPQKYWNRKEVERIMETAEFQREFAMTQRRKASQQKRLNAQTEIG